VAGNGGLYGDIWQVDKRPVDRVPARGSQKPGKRAQIDPALIKPSSQCARAPRNSDPSTGMSGSRASM